MAARKKMTVKEFFEKNNASVMRFAERFVTLLCDDELVRSCAEKDLEKLARVWRLVLEMAGENAGGESVVKLAELIGEYKDIDKEEE